MGAVLMASLYDAKCPGCQLALEVSVDITKTPPLLHMRRKFPRECVKCGCTDERACDGGCFWVSLDPPVCSRCAPKPKRKE